MQYAFDYTKSFTQNGMLDTLDSACSALCWMLSNRVLLDRENRSLPEALEAALHQISRDQLVGGIAFQDCLFEFALLQTSCVLNAHAFHDRDPVRRPLTGVPFFVQEI